MNEWGDLWPRYDLESIFSSVCQIRPPSAYREVPVCPWQRQCSITLCCSVSHMAEDAVLYYSLSHWEEKDKSSSSSQIYEIGCEVRHGLKLTQWKKLIERDENELKKSQFGTCWWIPVVKVWGLGWYCDLFLSSDLFLSCVPIISSLFDGKKNYIYSR